MDTLIWILILLIVFQFVLKQSFWPFRYTCAVAVAAAVFAGMSWPYAIEQSKTQMAGWLSGPALMPDMAVVLTVEVALQMAFCFLAVHVAYCFPVGRRMRTAERLLHGFPGVLIFPVLFFGLAQLIFGLPGVSFQQVAWGFAVVVLVVIPAGRWLMKVIVPEEDLRLELLFLTDAFIALLGMAATVNGRTAVEGTGAVNVPALAGCIGLFVLGGLAGLLERRWKRQGLKRRNRAK